MSYKTNLKYCVISQTMMGKFSLSLYVGRRMLYSILLLLFLFLPVMVKVAGDQNFVIKEIIFQESPKIFTMT